MALKYLPCSLAGLKLVSVLYRKNSEHTKLVMSGGQGPEEALPEGQAMADYAISHGIPESSVLIENKSKNTRKNMNFSQEIIHKDTEKEPTIAFATSWYHVYRSGIYAIECGMNIRGIGGKAKFYYGQNALIREFIAFFVLKRCLPVLLGICMLISAVIAAFTF